MVRYLITGGAGFFGINMARYLLARGQEVVSLDVAPFSYPERHSIIEVTGDIRNRADVDRAMRGVNIVIHAAAALPRYKPKEIYSTDVDGTRNVIASAHAHGVERFVHVSSTAVYGIPDHHPLYETDKLDGVGHYGRAKVQAEEVCAAYREQGMCVTIIRPKSFIGPERLGIFGLLYDWAFTGHHFPILGSGDNRYQLLDVEDLCAAIFLCCTLDQAKTNDTFNIGAKEFTTFREDYQTVLDVAGHGKRIIGLPAAPAIWTLRLLEALGVSPIYKWVYETADKDSFVSVENAERKLGFVPQFSNKESLIRNYQWYVDNIDQFQGQSGVNHRVPWKQGVLALAKYFF